MILVAGEALYDVFMAGENGPNLTFDARPGGSPFNVAFGLSRLGQASAFLGGFSTDFLGERLLGFLVNEGVSSAFVQRRDRPTTLAMAGLSPDGSAAYAFYGDRAADREVLLADMPKLPDDVRAIHLSSFSSVVNPIGTTMETLVRQESGRRVISYDPNIRPGIEPDMAVWRAKLDALTEVTHLIKLSEEDVALLYPGADPAALAAKWIARGVRLVALTRGGEGSQAWTKQHAVQIPAVPVTVVDTVGAGDTFQAALLTGLAELGRLSVAALANLTVGELHVLLTFAVQAAALTCSRRGADLPRRAELPALPGPGTSGTT